MTGQAPTPATLDADRRRDEHSVSAILRRQEQRSAELRRRRREAEDLDRKAAREAAGAGKVICGRCGCHTSYGELCWSCGEDPAAEEMTCIECRGERYVRRITRPPDGDEEVLCPGCQGRGAIEPICARLYEMSVEALQAERKRSEGAA